MPVPFSLTGCLGDAETLRMGLVENSLNVCANGKPRVFGELVLGGQRITLVKADILGFGGEIVVPSVGVKSVLDAIPSGIRDTRRGRDQGFLSERLRETDTAGNPG